MKRRTIALCGVPNCGKTTLFNLLTGSAQRTGNWPGVTVEYSLGDIQKRYLPSEEAPVPLLVDLPGLCSLHPYSPEEEVTLHYLQSRQADVILCMINACAPAQGLALALQLMSLRIPLILVFNMTDALHAAGGTLDTTYLERKLGIAAVSVCARNGKNIPFLMQEALACPPPDSAIPPMIYETSASDRYARIDALLAHCFKPGREQSDTLTSRLDRIALHRFWGWPLLLTVFALVFALVFVFPGPSLSEGVANAVASAIASIQKLLMQAHTPALWRSLLTEGLFRGLGTAFSLLPTLMLLFLLMALLEDSGYLSRAAFIFDAPLRYLGLSGRSFFPLMTGFGCTVPAVLSTRTLPGRQERQLTSLLTPYLPCSAKAPVYLYLGTLAFPGKSQQGVFYAYLLGFIVMLLASLPLRRCMHAQSTPLLMELPAYHLPTLHGTMRVMRDKVRDFISRAFTVIFATSLIIWFLQYFSPSLTATNQLSDSLLYRFSDVLQPLFAPLGFDAPPLIAALLAGLLAKENILCTLLLFSPVSALFTSSAGALSYLTFCALYAPCFASCAVIARECQSRKRMLLAVLFQTTVAWLAAFTVYRILG